MWVSSIRGVSLWQAYELSAPNRHRRLFQIYFLLPATSEASLVPLHRPFLILSGTRGASSVDFDHSSSGPSSSRSPHARLVASYGIHPYRMKVVSLALVNGRLLISARTGSPARGVGHRQDASTTELSRGLALLLAQVMTTIRAGACTLAKSLLPCF